MPGFVTKRAVEVWHLAGILLAGVSYLDMDCCGGCYVDCVG